MLQCTWQIKAGKRYTNAEEKESYESRKPLMGIEPITYRLRSDCSTVELQWRGQDYTKHVGK